jgi:hypothetical protein
MQHSATSKMAHDKGKPIIDQMPPFDKKHRCDSKWIIDSQPQDPESLEKKREYEKVEMRLRHSKNMSAVLVV